MLNFVVFVSLKLSRAFITSRFFLICCRCTTFLVVCFLWDCLVFCLCLVFWLFYCWCILWSVCIVLVWVLRMVRARRVLRLAFLWLLNLDLWGMKCLIFEFFDWLFMFLWWWCCLCILLVFYWFCLCVVCFVLWGILGFDMLIMLVWMCWVGWWWVIFYWWDVCVFLLVLVRRVCVIVWWCWGIGCWWLLLWVVGSWLCVWVMIEGEWFVGDFVGWIFGFRVIDRGRETFIVMRCVRLNGDGWCKGVCVWLYIYFINCK